jgi:hypothetical protein
MSKSRLNSRLRNTINGLAVLATPPATGQALVYNGLTWGPGAPLGLINGVDSTGIGAGGYLIYTGTGSSTSWTYKNVSTFPKITSFTGTPVYGASYVLTLTGSNLTNQLVATANTVPAIFNYISSTSATVTMPISTEITVFLYLTQSDGRFTFIKVM